MNVPFTHINIWPSFLSQALVRRKNRSVALTEFGPNHFQSDEDYFYFIHMNNSLRFVHAWSFVSALIVCIIGFVRWDWRLLLLQYFVSTLPAVLSHYVCDGFRNKGPVTRPIFTLVQGVRLNLNYLRIQTTELDKKFLIKYPFVGKIFDCSFTKK